MAIKGIQEMYEQGGIDKRQYVRKMAGEYGKLFEYQQLLQKTETVQSIRIGKDCVSISIENRDADNRPYFIEMVLDEKDYGAVPMTIMNFGNYEAEELRMVNRIGKYFSERGGCTLFDIGANLGWYTLNLCRQFDNIVSYAFEPVEDTFLRMKRNMERNQLTANCRLFHMGLSNETKKESFYYNASESGASSLVNIRENEETRVIECVFERMDEFVAENQITGIDFIKCDVEGAELLVYQGGTESIKKFKPVIFSEMLRKWSAKFNYHPNQIIAFLADMGYQCFTIHNNGLRLFDSVDEDTIETNYFFLHKDKHAQLIAELTENK